MPNFDLQQQPQFPVVTLDTDSPIDENIINNYLSRNKDVTICVRSETGHENRGGYFFTLRKSDDNLIILESIEGEYIDTLSLEKTVNFINHSTGLKFDKKMLEYCQNKINFRND